MLLSAATEQVRIDHWWNLHLNCIKLFLEIQSAAESECRGLEMTALLIKLQELDASCSRPVTLPGFTLDIILFCS